MSESIYAWFLACSVSQAFYEKGGEMDKRAFFIIGLISLCSIFLVPSAFFAQTTWYVDVNAPYYATIVDPPVYYPEEDGSAEYPFDTIQEGMDVSSHGDTVLVADGIYTGPGNRNLNFYGRAITVRSANGPENCIIDCFPGNPLQGGNRRAFYFHSGEGRDSVVQGFTIQNGYAFPGGGIYCFLSSSPTIVDNILIGNRAICDP